MSSSKYCTEAQVEETTLQWTIKNFSRLLHKKGKSIYSPFFYSKNNQEKWRLQFFPRGDKDSTEDYAALYLYLASGKLPVQVQCELSIEEFKYEGVEKTFVFKYYESYSGYGFPDFVERSFLLDGFHNGSYDFTICCKVAKPLKIVVKSLSNPPIAKIQELSVDTTIGQLTQNFAELLAKSRFSDVTIIVGDKKFPAHKLILAARSPVFAAMFENQEMNENTTNEIKIEKMEPAVVKGMLEFIYTDNVSNFDEISNGLLSAADKYDLVRLGALCEMRLAKTLSNETAVEVLVLADLHRCHNLKKHVMHFFDNHLIEILFSKDYKEMEEMYPELVKELFRFMALQKQSKKS